MSKCYWSLALKLWVSENNGAADASGLESDEGAVGREQVGFGSYLHGSFIGGQDATQSL